MVNTDPSTRCKMSTASSSYSYDSSFITFTRRHLQTAGIQPTLLSSTPQHFIHRHLPRATVPDSKSWYTMTTAEAGDSNCLFAIPNVDGSGPYPVRFKSCDPLEDDSLWQFVPDSQGHYFIYNKGWGSSAHRLDINCPDPSMCIMWMGPSGEIYNNQRWFLGGSNGQFKISSLGLPGSSLSSALVDNNYVGLMLDTTTVADDSKNWKLGDDTLTPSSSTIRASPTAPASSVAPASPVAPASSITLSPSVGLPQLDAPSVSSTPPQTETPSSSLASDTPKSSSPGMSSTVTQHERQSTTLASDMPKFSNPSVSSTTSHIGGPSASDTPEPKNSSIGLPVGLAVGGVILLVIAALILFCWWLPRRRKRRLGNSNEGVDGNGGVGGNEGVGGDEDVSGNEDVDANEGVAGNEIEMGELEYNRGEPRMVVT